MDKNTDKTTVPYTINETTITCYIGTEIKTIARDHAHAKQIIQALREGAPPSVLSQLFDKVKAMRVFMHGNVKIEGNKVFYKGKELHNVMVDRIQSFMADGLPYKSMVKFLDKLMQNPSYRSVELLYSFLEHVALPITPDGDFLAYKAIRNDWTDKHTGTISNHIGALVQEDRNKISDDPQSACSKGLHCGSINYVTGFSCGYGTPGGDRIVLVKVNPKDVVCVPYDCSCEKVRCCEYRVMAEYKDPLPSTYVGSASHPYSPEDDPDYDPDYDDDERDYEDLDDDERNEEEEEVPYVLGIVIRV